PALAAAVHAARRSPTLLVTARPARARQLYEEIRIWASDPAQVFHFPEPEAFCYERLRLDPETTATRRSLLARLAALPTAAPRATEEDGDEAPLIVTSVRALLDRLMTPEEMREQTVVLQAGTTIRPERLLDALVRLGYRRVSLVENPGEFA